MLRNATFTYVLGLLLSILLGAAATAAVLHKSRVPTSARYAPYLQAHEQFLRLYLFESEDQCPKR